MTENSIFWSTTDVGDGPAAGFSSSNIFEVYRSLLTGSVGANYGGVSPDYLNELAVSGATSPVSVATGAALVYGIPYFNSASVNVTVPTPASSTRIDRIVLRADWSAQTVRITRVAGIEGAGSAPALAQSAGVTWDIPLARVTITTAGSITLTDDRQFLSLIGDSAVVTAKLNDLAVTTAKLADACVTSVKIADSNVTTAKLADSGVTTAKIADSNVTTAKIADSNVTTAKIADSNVTTAKVADDAISNVKLANMAQTTVKGRALGAGTGDPVDLTAAQLVDILETADGSGSGLDADTVDGLHASSFWQASNDGSGSGLDADLLDGQHGSYYLPASSYTASDVLTKIKTVDGTGTGLDADLLDGQHGSYYLPSASYTAADVLTKIKTVDGAGSGLDADLLDGQSSSYYLPASSYTASDVLAKLVTVDGPGSNIDADSVDGLGVDSSWTYALGVSVAWNYTANTVIYYRKICGIVNVRCYIETDWVGNLAGSPIVTLPVGYRPAYFSEYMLMMRTGTVYRCRVQTDGQMFIEDATASGLRQYTISFTYFAG